MNAGIAPMNERLVEETRRRWSALRAEIERHFALLWDEAELPNMEYRSAEALADWLTREGFEVERAPHGLPTAFIGRWHKGGKGTGQHGKDKAPRIGLLAEYDALPGTSNRPVPRRESSGKRAGHACGHNQIGPANIGAAIAARQVMDACDIAGEILVFGCPAEEIVWGKLALLRAGAFDGCDALLTSHADYQNGAISRPCQSVMSGEIIFTGESGHGGGVRRQNALDAAELAVQSIERLRAHHFPDTSVEHVLRVGGHMPSVTPDEARLWLVTRHVDIARAEAVYRFVAGVAEQAARLCTVAYREQFIAGTRGYLANDALARILLANLQRVGTPRYSEGDIAWLRDLARACRPAEPFELDGGMALHDEGHDPYGQDDGEASWHIPLARANWAIPKQVPLHNWACSALTGHAASYPGPLMASEALALTAIELMTSPDALVAARAELQRRREGVTIEPPPLGAWNTMTAAPERFWDATWIEN
ncbi:MAG TPA: peptidase dimerization domain-containing protein [Dongiaceae bacterium]|jgi:aminobenzoyl-glutamate utilization protein B|nr:peptidase dimerization domain-containing protein [Dongiaceae bacterium]